MKKPIVSINKYESSPDSLAKAIEEAKGFEKLQIKHRVLIKPNLVGWDPMYPIAPYGVYTTSRLVEDMVILLKDYGVKDIIIGEGSAPRGKKEKDQLVGTRLIFSALGYPYLLKKYGVRLVDFFEEPFEAVEFEGISLNISKAALEAEFIINMPVLKTHNQAKLSLGLKNLKGCIDLKSRRLCHHESISLDYFCSLFVEMIPPSITVLDGIYGLEKGPYYLGTAHRMNAVIVSRDPLAVDVVGAMMAGFEPSTVEHIAIHAKRNNRSLDLDSLSLKGLHPDEFKRSLKWDYSWREDNTGPRNWDKLGVSGISIPKYDQTICTGCSSMYNPLLMLITSAYKGKPFDGIEVLTGKKMRSSPGFNKTILFGNCMIKKNRKDPNIKEPVYIKGCPVAMEEIIGQLENIGLKPDVSFFAQFRESLAKRYRGKPAFDPSHYFMPGATGKNA
ncbi:MAG: DUF362 domain-containing protein [Desulfobacterales bacterium]|nr:DUF362 domain-containing protein [Desulfobacterales bacterium]